MLRFQPNSNGGIERVTLLAVVAVLALAGAATAHTDAEAHGSITLHDEADGEPKTSTDPWTDPVQVGCQVWVRGYGLDHANGTIEAEHGALLDAHAHTAASWNASGDGQGDVEVGPFTLHEGDNWTVWAGMDGHGTEEHDVTYEECTEEPTPPRCPRGLHVDARSTNEVTLAWNASAKADTYLVHRAPAGGNLSQVAELASTSYVDTQVEANTTYTFLVASANENGQAEGCRAIEVATPDLSVPVCPADVRVHATATDAVALTWNASGEAETHRVVRVAANGSTQTVAEVEAEAFVDLGVDLTTDLAYRVVAVNAGGQADGCPTVEVTAPDERQPSCPGDLAADPKDSEEIRLTWAAVGEAETYHVYRAEAGGALQHVAETNATSHVDQSTSAEQTYRYEVTAETEAGEAEACPTVEATAIPFFPDGVTVGLLGVASVGIVAALGRTR
jgi:fibronectin type 3 domain-containing protein